MKLNDQILIYRLGSIGDTVIALPAIRLVAKHYPNARRILLTNRIGNEKGASPESILIGMRLVDGYLAYPRKTRSLTELLRIVLSIRQRGIKTLVYLAAPRGIYKAYRDILFFRLCGIKEMIGVPTTQDLQKTRQVTFDLWEHESERLKRCVSKLGNDEEFRLSDYSLDLTEAERGRAQNELRGWLGAESFIAACVGSKIDVKDWGVDNWSEVFTRLGDEFPGLGLVLVGSEDEYKDSERAVRSWSGPVRILCGKLTPRETAAVLEKACIFMGHDSGPMHLAATVGTKCVAVFSARNRPGEWFPIGDQHKVFYEKTDCFGCGLMVCEKMKKVCIRSIEPSQVTNGSIELLRESLSTRSKK